MHAAVNTKFERVDKPRNVPAVNDVLRLNHYVLRSREEFEGKMQRGDGMGNQ